MTRPDRLAWLWWLVVLAGLSGCVRQSDAVTDPPLRPLLYTEPAPGVDPAIEGYTLWQDPHVDPVAFPTAEQSMIASAVLPAGEASQDTPAALMSTVFQALVHQDRASLDACLFEPEMLATAAHMGQDAARREAAEIREATYDLFALFDQGPPSQARDGGLASVLDADQIVVGRGRHLDGSVVEDSQDARMHWGSELSFRLHREEVSFEMRFPKLLLGDDGQWYLGAAPVAGALFRAYRATGMDLKPELMSVEHAAFPLSVGSYWEYRTRQPGANGTEEEYGFLTSEGYRDEVVALDVYSGYRVARLQRTYRQAGETPDTFGYLMTPTQVYRCGRECRRRASSLEWTLAYCQRQTPLYVFPLEPNRAWGVGGRESGQTSYRVQSSPVAVSAPAGNFSAAIEIVRSTARGRESRFFERGVGLVMQRTQSSLETEIVELVSYRILP